MMSEPVYTVVKVVLSGDLSVGKTHLLRREVDNEFQKDYPGNIGLDFKIKLYQIDDIAVKGQIWDLAHSGGQKFHKGNINFYRNAHSIGFCFAVNNKASFHNLHKLISEVRSSNTEARVFLIGCKGDQMPEMADEEVTDYAEKHQLTYFRTSSMQNWGVNELFYEMMKQGLPVKLAQGSKQKAIPTEPPCKYKCEIM